jgi:hypothetical protein
MNRPDLPQSWKNLRTACSKQLLEWRGVIPGLRKPMVEADGKVRIVVTRGESEGRVTLEQYCHQIETSLYGGTEELMLIAQMFNVRIHVFHNESYIGGDPFPIESFKVNPMDSHDVTDIYLLLETGGKGIADHHTLMIHKHARHKELMSRAPIVDIDYCVAESDYGYGLMAMRIFEEGDFTGNSFTSIIIHFYSAACCCLLELFMFFYYFKFVQTGWYDGHRVDTKGNVVIRRDSVDKLMKKFPEIDRELTGEAFRTTHAARLGRIGSKMLNASGLVIDGGPLAHRCLDHEPNVGRMSLADSANFTQKNM